MYVLVFSKSIIVLFICTYNYHTLNLENSIHCTILLDDKCKNSISLYLSPRKKFSHPWFIERLKDNLLSRGTIQKELLRDLTSASIQRVYNTIRHRRQNSRLHSWKSGLLTDSTALVSSFARVRDVFINNKCYHPDDNVIIQPDDNIDVIIQSYSNHIIQPDDNIHVIIQSYFYHIIHLDNNIHVIIQLDDNVYVIFPLDDDIDVIIQSDVNYIIHLDDNCSLPLRRVHEIKRM